MRTNDVQTPKIIRIFPILFMVVWVAPIVFNMIVAIADKVTYDKAMERAVEVNAVCEEVYNGADTQNGIAVKYATVSFEYKGKTKKISQVEIPSDKFVGDTVTIRIDPETDNMLLGFDTTEFVFGLVIMGIFLIVGVAMFVSFVKSLKNPKEKIDPWEIN